VDHLCRGLGGPGHGAYGAPIGLQHDVDLGGAHRGRGIRRVITGHGLQEDALRQAQALLFREFLGRHDLAARDASHVRDDRLDLGNPAFAEEGSDLAGHVSPAPVACRRAQTRGLPKRLE
jgi:hypothetical protein